MSSFCQLVCAQSPAIRSAMPSLSASIGAAFGPLINTWSHAMRSCYCPMLTNRPAARKGGQYGTADSYCRRRAEGATEEAVSEYAEFVAWVDAESGTGPGRK